MHCERKQICIRKLPMAAGVSGIEGTSIAEGNGVRPENVVTAVAEAAQPAHGIRHGGSSTRVGGIGKNSHQGVLGQRACSPAFFTVRGEPLVSRVMVSVQGVEEGYQNVDIQERAQVASLLVA
jgi:hypothetical protein